MTSPQFYLWPKEEEEKATSLFVADMSRVCPSRDGQMGVSQPQEHLSLSPFATDMAEWIWTAWSQSRSRTWQSGFGLHGASHDHGHGRVALDCMEPVTITDMAEWLRTAWSQSRSQTWQSGFGLHGASHDHRHGRVALSQ